MTTDKQGKVLLKLAEYEAAPSARQIADNLERPRHRGAVFTYDEVYGQLKALERKARVRRVDGRPVRWVLTAEGEAEVEALKDLTA